MKFYASKAHDKLNGQPFNPELVTRNICLNPKYNTTIIRKNQTNVLLDSGAFQDVANQQRLSFKKALERQRSFEDKLGITSEMIVSYDRLVDEQYRKDVGQIKKRVVYKTAEKYVEETIDAAKFLVDRRNELSPRKLVLSNQGIEINQYIRCIKEVLSFSEKGDIIGFGGFCIIGLKPKYEPEYYEVLKKALPMIKGKGINRVHVFGVGKFRPLVKTQLLCKKHGIEPSYDTSSCEVNSVMGSMFNVYPNNPNGPKFPEDTKLTQVFWKGEKFNEYHPAKLALFNIKLINNFWKELNRADLI